MGPLSTKPPAVMGRFSLSSTAAWAAPVDTALWVCVGEAEAAVVVCFAGRAWAPVRRTLEMTRAKRPIALEISLLMDASRPPSYPSMRGSTPFPSDRRAFHLYGKCRETRPRD